MPEYRLSLEFTAPDDEHARKRADDIADLAAVEHGTRNPIVTPADGDLRDLIEAHIAQVYDRSCAANAAQVAMAIVGPKLERLRGELAETRAKLDRVIQGRTQAHLDRNAQRQRAEQAEEAAAEWQAACEAHQRDGEALMAAIERVRAIYKARFQDAQTGQEAPREFILALGEELAAALDAPSGTDGTRDANEAFDVGDLPGMWEQADLVGGETDSVEILDPASGADSPASDAETRLAQLRAYARWCNDRSVEPETRDILAIADGREHHDYVVLMKRQDGAE